MDRGCQYLFTGVRSLENPAGVFEGEDESCHSISASEEEGEESGISGESCSSDLSEDATSPSSSQNLISNGPLYELSSLMAQLPIKRGLSKYFQGKSQSFTSLSNVRCLEDLVKRESPYKKKMKQCKSYGGGLDCHRSYSVGSFKRTMSKRTQRGSFSSLLSRNSGGCSVAACRPPVAMQDNM
ncbi:hypothetical protein QJS10_CPB20g00574 [Acorus calamus]|uniref:Oxidative stress 3 n=1 Tax=Acorus calamus TaxID=4465 RepID=A0AAV9C9L2_ACOCL|nr:hypothetical protein QJS10_CPB20g00574 [Acorus calamus]